MTAGAVTTNISAAAVQIYRCNIQPLLIEESVLQRERRVDIEYEESAWTKVPVNLVDR